MEGERNMNISKRKFLLAMAREKLTVNSLAIKAGIGRVTISGIKNGKITTVQPETLGRLAAALEVDVTELIEN
jgi:DNA-binding Xre family transcriptional regulator